MSAPGTASAETTAPPPAPAYSCPQRDNSTVCARVRERNLLVAQAAVKSAGSSVECGYPVDPEELVTTTPLRYCDTGPRGSSWYIELRSVAFLCPGYTAAWDVVHEDPGGRRAVYHPPEPATLFYTLSPLHAHLRTTHYPGGPGSDDTPCAFDYDGDGDAELVLWESRLELCTSRASVVLTHAGGEVKEYAPSRGLHIDGLVDLDGDGRPDPLTTIGFDVACAVPFKSDCATLRWPVPVHARADGSFAPDESTRSFLRARCAAALHRASLLVRTSDERVDDGATAHNILCSVLAGSEAADLERRLARECGAISASACDDDAPALCRAWFYELARATPPISLQ